MRKENTKIDRVIVHNLKQDRDEPIWHLEPDSEAKLVSVSTSTGAPDVTPILLHRDNLKRCSVRGLNDPEIQMDLLGNKNHDVMLEQVLRFVEAKEAGKRSASRLLLPHATDAVTECSYGRQKKTSMKGPPPKGQELCMYCGSKGHG